MAKQKTQNEMIIDYVMEHGSITHLEAVERLERPVMRLAARIPEIEKEHKIFFDRVPVRKKLENGAYERYTKYVKVN